MFFHNYGRKLRQILTERKFIVSNKFSFTRKKVLALIQKTIFSYYFFLNMNKYNTTYNQSVIYILKNMIFTSYKKTNPSTF